MVWTNIRGDVVGVPAVGDYVIVGDGPPRWETAAAHDKAERERRTAETAEAERVAGLTVEERQAEILALCQTKTGEPTFVLPTPPSLPFAPAT